MDPAPAIWIIVLNWNGVGDTLVCLESLRRLPSRGLHIVVVDNGSVDDSVAVLRREAGKSPIEILEARTNLGYAGGNNLGIRYALDRGADFILILNNDTIVDPALLDELVAAANRNPRAGCFGPWLFYMHDPERLWWTRSEWNTAAVAFSSPGKDRLTDEVAREAVETAYVCGAALFFRAAVAHRIGLFEERFFLVYEDSDWCFRARRAGFDCLSVPSARVWHKVGTSFGSEDSPLRTYFSTRNKLLWAERNLPRRELVRMVRLAGRRLLPQLNLRTWMGHPFHKALVWGLRGYAREWSRKLRDPQEAAHRRGVLDYLGRRFGDCPQGIRVLTQTWAESQRSREPRGTTRPGGGADDTLQLREERSE